jgi:integrase
VASVEKRLRDGKVTWLARWRDSAGTQRKRSFTRKVDADRFLTTVEHSMLTGGYVDPAAGKVTFKTYAEQWRAQQPHRPSTAKAVHQHLRAYAYTTLGARPIAAIRPSEVQAWATGLQTSLAPSTMRTVLNTIKAVFKAAAADRLIAYNPCESVRLPPVPRRRLVPLTVEQVQTIIESAPSQYRALLVLGAGTGLRAGELFGLQVRHVDFLRRHLTVEQQVQQTAGQAVYVCPPKTQSSYRVVPLPQTVVDALANHLRGRGAGPNDFIFTAPSGGPVVRTSFMHSTWAPAAKAAGLAKGVGLHSLRHFYASALIRGGLSVKVVSERLGHANAAMTLNVYAHLWPDDEDRTRQAVDDLFGVSVEPRVASTLKLSESLSVAGKDRSTLRAAR